MSGRIDAVQQGRVLVLTMDDPATKNALSAEMMDAGRAAFESAATDPGIGAVVLTGSPGTFCSGGNLGQLMGSRKADPSVIRDMMERFHGWVRAMRTCPKPVIAAVEGSAAGAGFSVALGCDLIVAAEDSSFVLAYVKVGLNPDGGASAFLGRAVPPQLAAEIMFEGGRIGTPRLAQLGVVNRVPAPGGTLEGASAREMFEALHVAEVSWRRPGPPPWFDCDTDDDLRTAEEWVR